MKALPTHLRAHLIDRLGLDDRARTFVISVSGGVDSSVLVFLLSELAQHFKIRLHLFHVNFQLRGRESVRDEKFVRALAKKYKISLTVKRVHIKTKTAIQEQARRLRISSAKSVKPKWEWIEAHHFDDQLETFFFKLFRGAGPRGLAGMKTKSIRENRCVFRPLLEISKAELRAFAKEHKLKFVEDSSNATDRYDRNWIRLKLLPLIEGRFPSARKSIQRLMKILGEEAAARNRVVRDTEKTVVTSKQPLVWSWAPLRDYADSDLNDFVLSFLREHLSVEMSHRHIVELTKGLKTFENFSFNAPKKILVRGRRRSGTVPFDQIRFYRDVDGQLAPVMLRTG